MALRGGSPCFQSWGSLVAGWGSYSQAWRALAVPVALAAVSLPAVTGGLASAYDGQISAPIPGVSAGASGGRMLPAPVSLARWGDMRLPWRWYPRPWRQVGRSASADAVISVSSSGGLMRGAGASASLGASAVASGSLALSGSASGVVSLVVDSLPGGRLRITTLPTGRMSRGRLTWRI